MDINEAIKDLRALEFSRHRRLWKPFMKKYNCRKIAELGVFIGQNFKKMIQHHPDVAVAVDLWREDGNPARNDSGFTQEKLDQMHDQFVADINAIRRKEVDIQIYREYTVDVARYFPENYFDLIYIDADHTFDGCLADIKAWYPKVQRGKFLTGDDYSNSHAPVTGVRFGVIKAVNTFAAEQSLKVYELPSNGWALIKR